MIIKLLEQNSEFRDIYEEIYNICRNSERMMGMFSKELEILDRNTVKLMIDELDEALGEEREKVKAIKQERESELLPVKRTEKKYKIFPASS